MKEPTMLDHHLGGNDDKGKSARHLRKEIESTAKMMINMTVVIIIMMRFVILILIIISL